MWRVRPMPSAAATKKSELMAEYSAASTPRRASRSAHVAAPSARSVCSVTCALAGWVSPRGAASRSAQPRGCAQRAQRLLRHLPAHRLTGHCWEKPIQRLLEHSHSAKHVAGGGEDTPT